MPRYDESVKLAASALLAIGVASITLVQRLEAGDAVPVASADEAFQSALASQKLAERTAQADESAACFQKGARRCAILGVACRRQPPTF